MEVFNDELLEFTKSLKVLYVEDNEEARLAVGELLSCFFDHIVTAVDGVDGLEKFENGDFDLLVSDIKMPRMNGVDMAKTIKAMSPNIAIVIVTAHQESEYLLECIRCSVDGYLLKPISIQALEEVIFKIANQLYCTRAAQEYEIHLTEEVKKRTQELELAQKELINMVNKDPMTGLYNRRYFNEVANSLLKITKREGKDLSVLMLDIDKFKEVNDTYGHLVGDAILKELALMMMHLTRESDIIVRFGGEEFIILLPNTDEKGAVAIAKKIRENIAMTELQIEGNKSIKITVSIGVATCYCDADTDIDQIVHRVDVAMYDAKKSGRNKVVLYNQEAI